MLFDPIGVSSVPAMRPRASPDKGATVRLHPAEPLPRSQPALRRGVFEFGAT